MSAYEAVIGLEVHAQLHTRTKIFCGCSTVFGMPANSQTCPVCLGHPGALPVLNRRAVEFAIRGALALDCEIRSHSIFARKNYFYPDLPKGYQISQYEEPLAVGGRVPIELDGESRTIGLTRIHMEEDAGKSIHDGMPDSAHRSYVDLNRTGVPLVEIVSEPELRSPEEAHAFLQRLRSTLRYIEICDGNMEEGSFRCDANVSIRPRGATTLGTRTELKNLNSFRHVQRALEYEIERQKGVVDSGGEVVQQTVLWDAATGKTRPMRSKEEAHDYRYFPDPDLLPLVVDPRWVEELAVDLPELPAPRKQRMRAEYSLTEYEAQLLSLEAPIADYFEAVARESTHPKAAANFVLNDLPREQKLARRDETDIPLPAEHLAALIRMIDSGAISNTVARQELFAEMISTGKPLEELVRDKGLEQVSDDETLIGLIRTVIEENSAQVEIFRGGKTGVFGYLVGQVMKASGGKANPKKVADLLKEELG